VQDKLPLHAPSKQGLTSCIFSHALPELVVLIVLLLCLQGNWREMQAVLQAMPHLHTANAGRWCGVVWCGVCVCVCCVCVCGGGG